MGRFVNFIGVAKKAVDNFVCRSRLGQVPIASSGVNANSTSPFVRHRREHYRNGRRIYVQINRMGGPREECLGLCQTGLAVLDGGGHFGRLLHLDVVSFVLAGHVACGRVAGGRALLPPLFFAMMCCTLVEEQDGSC